jgi:hypothetical protein
MIIKGKNKERKARLVTTNKGKEKILVKFPYGPKFQDDLSMVREFDNRKFEKAGGEKYWLTDISLSNLQKLIENGFEMEDDLKEKARSFYVNWNQISNETVGDKFLDKRLRGFQKEAVNFVMQNIGKGLIALPQGGGKALWNEEKVLTLNGWVKNKILKKGDYVIGSNGTPIKILNVFPQGKKELYKVHFQDGTHVICDKDHLWKVNYRHHNNAKKIVEIRSKILSTNELLKEKYHTKNFDKRYNTKNYNYKFRIPVNKPVEFTKKQLPIDPYTLGVILGDGGLSGSGIYLSLSNTEIIKKLKLPKELEFIVSEKTKKCITYRVTNVNKHKRKKNQLVELLKEYNLMGKKSIEKTIPKIYLQSDIEDRKNLLQGLLDTDGHDKKKDGLNFEYSTSSEKLKNDVLYLVRSLGIYVHYVEKLPYYTYKGERKKGQKSYRIYINFKKKFKSLTKIEYWGKDCASCIEVESNDNLYIANGFNLTHNTIVSLGFMRLRPNWSPVLIIVRASLKINWLREAKKWLENPDVEIIGGTTPYKTTGSIVIANYDILSPRYNWVTNEQEERKRVLQPGTGWIEELQRRNFQLAILDESTAIKNHESNRTKAAEKIVKNVPGKILLTGTPIENRPAEIYTSIRMINKQLFPSKINFDIRFCAGHDDGYGWNNKGASNTKVLHNILSNTLMFRRKKAEIMPELPPKTRSFIPVEIDNMQEYKSAERDFINYVKEKGKPSASHLAMINELKQLAVKGKMPVIVQWIKEMLDVNDKLVVFMHHKFVSRQLLKEFKGRALKIDGDVSTNMRKDGTSPRQDVIDRFENDPKIQLLVANYEAGGYGLNLQFASEGGHLELMWNSSIHEQAIDRMHRMTQKDTVNEYFMIALDTIEETIADIIDTKSDVSGQIVDGEELQQENMLKKLIDKYREEE